MGSDRQACGLAEMIFPARTALFRAPGRAVRLRRRAFGLLVATQADGGVGQAEVGGVIVGRLAAGGGGRPLAAFGRPFHRAGRLRQRDRGGRGGGGAPAGEAGPAVLPFAASSDEEQGGGQAEEGTDVCGVHGFSRASSEVAFCGFSSGPPRFLLFRTWQKSGCLLKSEKRNGAQNHDRKSSKILFIK